MRGGEWLMNATCKFYTGEDLFDLERPATPPWRQTTPNDNATFQKDIPSEFK
jgi:hypothetical protein